MARKPLMDKAMQRQYLSVHRTGGKPKIKCANCGDTFQYNPRGRFRHFCSTKCRVQYYRATEIRS